MAIVLSDPQIAAYISDVKELPANFLSRAYPKPKRGHKENELSVTGQSGAEYRMIFRLSNLNQLDFSVNLAVQLPSSTRLFRLRRYNGKSHEHTNRIEKATFFGFHIHLATARYQDIGLDEDAYAEPSDRFSDYSTAVQCLIEDCGCTLASGSALPF